LIFIHSLMQFTGYAILQSVDSTVFTSESVFGLRTSESELQTRGEAKKLQPLKFNQSSAIKAIISLSILFFKQFLPFGALPFTSKFSKRELFLRETLLHLFLTSSNDVLCIILQVGFFPQT